MEPHSAAVVRVYGKDRLGMAALALGFAAVIEIKACMVSRTRMAGDAWLGAGHVEGLGIPVTQPAGLPVEGHIGHIGHGVHVDHRIALIDVTQGTVDVCLGCMHTHTAAVIRCNGKCWLGMAALAFLFRTIVQLETGVGTCSAVAQSAGGITRGMIRLGLGMTEPAIHPVKEHSAQIRRHARIVRPESVIQWIALPYMAAVALPVCRCIVQADPAPVIRHDIEDTFLLDQDKSDKKIVLAFSEQ